MKFDTVLRGFQTRWHNQTASPNYVDPFMQNTFLKPINTIPCGLSCDIRSNEPTPGNPHQNVNFSEEKCPELSFLQNKSLPSSSNSQHSMKIYDIINLNLPHISTFGRETLPEANHPTSAQENRISEHSTIIPTFEGEEMNDKSVELNQAKPSSMTDKNFSILQSFQSGLMSNHCEVHQLSSSGETVNHLQLVQHSTLGSDEEHVRAQLQGPSCVVNKPCAMGHSSLLDFYEISYNPQPTTDLCDNSASKNLPLHTVEDSETKFATNPQGLETQKYRGSGGIKNKSKLSKSFMIQDILS
jgi:hypothetical protein